MPLSIQSAQPSASAVLPKWFDTAALQQHGWTVARGAVKEDVRGGLLEVARRLGTPVAMRPSDGLVARLTVREPSPGERSLTGQFGTGSFPFHIDTAHWLNPVRYVCLGCEGAGVGRSTGIVDTCSLSLSPRETAVMKFATFRFGTGKHAFYSSIVDQSRPFMRWDPGCMRPMSASAIGAFQIMACRIAEVRAHFVEWAEGDLLVFDNWRVFHNRGAGCSPDTGRALLRVGVAH